MILLKVKRNVYPSYNGDSETFNSISYADCAGIEIPKVRRKTIALVITNFSCPKYNNNEDKMQDNSSEELYNLDNDSFLNSLEAISFPDTWPEAKL